jgi:DNA-binding response OmpR family regulator
LTRILLVEDDANVRPIIQHTLISAGHDVDIAATMAEGFGLLRQRTYDLVVADAKLPDGTGMAVLDQAADSGTRGFIITGYAFSLPSEMLQDYEILLKPLRPAEIVAAVDSALRA